MEAPELKIKVFPSASNYLGNQWMSAAKHALNILNQKVAHLASPLRNSFLAKNGSSRAAARRISAYRAYPEKIYWRSANPNSFKTLNLEVTHFRSLLLHTSFWPRIEAQSWGSKHFRLNLITWKSTERQQLSVFLTSRLRKAAYFVLSLSSRHSFWAKNGSSKAADHNIPVCVQLLGDPANVSS